MSLTDTAIRALKPGMKRYERADRDGLFLEVLPLGQMTWRYRYRLNGKREKLTIGPYPAVGLREARDRRQLAEKILADGPAPTLRPR